MHICSASRGASPRESETRSERGADDRTDHLAVERTRKGGGGGSGGRNGARKGYGQKVTWPSEKEAASTDESELTYGKASKRVKGKFQSGAGDESESTDASACSPHDAIMSSITGVMLMLSPTPKRTSAAHSCGKPSPLGSASSGEGPISRKPSSCSRRPVHDGSD